MAVCEIQECNLETLRDEYISDGLPLAVSEKGGHPLCEMKAYSSVGHRVPIVFPYCSRHYCGCFCSWNPHLRDVVFWLSCVTVVEYHKEPTSFHGVYRRQFPSPLRSRGLPLRGRLVGVIYPNFLYSTISHEISSRKKEMSPRVETTPLRVPSCPSSLVHIRHVRMRRTATIQLAVGVVHDFFVYNSIPYLNLIEHPNFCVSLLRFEIAVCSYSELFSQNI